VVSGSSDKERSRAAVRQGDGDVRRPPFSPNTRQGIRTAWSVHMGATKWDMTKRWCGQLQIVAQHPRSSGGDFFLPFFKKKY
jgi:hypothetical protein